MTHKRDWSTYHHRYEYDSQFQDYIYYAGRLIAFRTTEPAVAYDRNTFTMLKHGDADVVTQWSQDYRKKLCASGFEVQAQNLEVVMSKQWDIDDLNMVIHSSGYLRTLLLP